LRLASFSQQPQTNGKIERYTESFIDKVNFVRKYCANNELAVPSELDLLLENTNQISGDTVQTKNPQHLVTLLFKYRPKVLHIANLIKKSSASIHSPESNFDNPTEFPSFLPLVVPIEATIANVLDTSALMLKITFPDRSSRFTPLFSTSFKPSSPLHFDLNTTTKISQKSFTEKSMTEISIVKAIELDKHDFELTDFGWDQNNRENLGFVELCQPRKYYILPKQTLS